MVGHSIPARVRREQDDACGNGARSPGENRRTRPDPRVAQGEGELGDGKRQAGSQGAGDPGSSAEIGRPQQGDQEERGA